MGTQCGGGNRFVLSEGYLYVSYCGRLLQNRQEWQAPLDVLG